MFTPSSYPPDLSGTEPTILGTDWQDGYRWKLAGQAPEEEEEDDDDDDEEEEDDSDGDDKED